MRNAADRHLTPADVFSALCDHPRRWLVPLCVMTLLGLVYALVRPKNWEASQALIIREEATVDHDRLGSFTDVDEMKTVQETILELARSKSVLRAALVEAGPPADYEKPAAWPTDRDIANLRDQVKMTPPGGAEFGKTEVFYLKVRDHDRPRSVALVESVADQLESRFKSLRNARFQSMVDELQKSAELAEADLDQATRKLAEFESSMGIDLAELRMMQISAAAHSDLRQKRGEVQSEIRGYQAAVRQNEQMLVLLQAAQHDPGRLLASPNSLLDSQPALRRLKEGLIDAQLTTARLEGSMSVHHPRVQSAKAAEQEISEQLTDELAIAIKGIEHDLSMTTERLAALNQQAGADQARLARLAGLRAQYENLVAMKKNRNDTLETTRGYLADARANQIAAGTVSLISRIDVPEAGIDPLGPSRSMITLAGMMGGLLTGLGLVFLTIQPQPAGGTNPHEHAMTVPLEEVIVYRHAGTAGSLSFQGALEKLDGLTLALQHE